jgi:putative polyhydroxyalkanoate system protein
MAEIHIERKHNLGKEKARGAVEEVARDIRQNLQVEYRWEGDTLKFERSGASGTIAVSDADVIVDIELSGMLGAFSGMVEGQVGNYLNKYLV